MDLLIYAYLTTL